MTTELTQPVAPKIDVTQIESRNSELQKQIPGIVEKALAFVVNSLEDYDRAVDFGKTITTMRKQAAEIKEELKRPHLDFNKLVDAQFNALDKPLERAENSLKQQMLEYKRKAEAEAAAAKAKADKEAADRAMAEAAAAEAAGNVGTAAAIVELAVARSEMPVAPVIAKTTHTGFGSASVKKGPWMVEVLDANLIERKYLVLDEALVKAAAKAGETNFPGLKVWQADTVAFK